ncbi:MAG: glycosyltransferase [Bacteroidetes bacterium]|nr:glycosyltransferase [Bacteroidota bacterium]
MKVFIQTPYEDCDFHGHKLSHMSYDSFLSNKVGLASIIKHGVSGSTLFARLNNPWYLQKLYLAKDKEYFKFLYEFKERYEDYDVIVMNPGVDLVHPEFLYKHFPNTLKCLHFVDDPHATYSYCFPFSWVFDCATYISPSYNNEFTMPEILHHVGLKLNKWFPLCNSNLKEPIYSINELKKQLSTRNNKIIYVGNYYSNKNKRLSSIKHKLKSDFDIFGKTPLGGYMFPINSTINGFPSRYRVRSISNKERELFYSKYSIGLNMHLSTPGLETGNARLYELAYRGVAQVVDSGGASLVGNIFRPGDEILTYQNERECIDNIRLLQSDENLRMSLALSAYKRAIVDYSYPSKLIEVLDWYEGIIK